MIAESVRCEKRFFKLIFFIKSMSKNHEALTRTKDVEPGILPSSLCRVISQAGGSVEGKKLIFKRMFFMGQ